jgi:hypothetical protein
MCLIWNTRSGMGKESHSGSVFWIRIDYTGMQNCRSGYQYCKDSNSAFETNVDPDLDPVLIRIVIKFEPSFLKSNKKNLFT